MQTSSVLEPQRKSVRKDPTVVILDDDLLTLAALRRALRGEPYILLTADEPDRVLEWVESRDISIVVSDLLMPRWDGAQLLQEVWVRSPLTVGVILTAYPESFSIDSAPAQWVRRVIPKPWRDGLLRMTLRHLLWERMEPRPESSEGFEGFDYDLGGEG